jgi:hypothetical protein
LREEGFGEDGGRAVGGRGGVVHSFTGSPQEANDYVRARDSPSEADITKRCTQINMGFHIRFVLRRMLLVSLRLRYICKRQWLLPED